MLNDILALQRGLVVAGVTLSTRHPDIKGMAKGRGVRVRLGNDGQVTTTELVEQTGNGYVWTLRNGQHNGFPGLKTTSGLLDVDAQSLIKHRVAWQLAPDVPAKRGELEKLLAIGAMDANKIANWPSEKHRDAISARLSALSSLENEPSTAAVPAVFRRFLRSLTKQPTLLKELLDSLINRGLHGGNEWLEIVRDAMVGPIPLVFDVDIHDPAFMRDAGDLRQIEPVSEALSDSVHTAKTDSRRCALTGDSKHLHSGPFPQPNLPGLGQTYLFSRNADIPALTRYGNTADRSYPIADDLVRQLSATLVKLCDNEAKGHTWRLIPGEVSSKTDLMLIGIADQQGAANALDDDSDEGETRLREIGKRIVEQSSGQLRHSHAENEVTVLVLRTVDKANRKAIYQRKLDAISLHRAAQDWQAAVQNTPAWPGFPLPDKTQGIRWVSSRYVAPLSLIRLSQLQLVSGGQRRVSVIGIKAADAFELFLNEHDARHLARRILRMIIVRNGELLGRLTQALNKGNDLDHLRKFDPKLDLREHALRVRTWIGVLLYRLDYRQSEIEKMENTEFSSMAAAFRFGQLLSVADIIHIGYCADLRKGDVPPTLLGNSVLNKAAANPIVALAILQSRLKPYLGWARRHSYILSKAQVFDIGNKEDQFRAVAMRTALSAASRAQTLARELHELLLLSSAVIRPDDVFKAELLLGYMAGLPKQERASKPDIHSSQETNKSESL